MQHCYNRSLGNESLQHIKKLAVCQEANIVIMEAIQINQSHCLTELIGASRSQHCNNGTLPNKKLIKVIAS